MRQVDCNELTSVFGGAGEVLSVGIGPVCKIMGGMAGALSGLFVGPFGALALARLGYVLGVEAGAAHYVYKSSSRKLCS